MHKFAHPLELGDDSRTRLPAFGFLLTTPDSPQQELFITDPFLSECGRFPADPTETYGLSADDAKQLAALNKLIQKAADNALNAGCLTIQEELGIESGDLAGLHFSGTDHVYPVAKAMADYLLSEYNMAHKA